MKDDVIITVVSILMQSVDAAVLRVRKESVKKSQADRISSVLPLTVGKRYGFSTSF